VQQRAARAWSGHLPRHMQITRDRLDRLQSTRHERDRLNRCTIANRPAPIMQQAAAYPMPPRHCGDVRPGSKLSAVIGAFSRGSQRRLRRCGPSIVTAGSKAVIGLCGTPSQSECARSSTSQQRMPSVHRRAAAQARGCSGAAR